MDDRAEVKDDWTPPSELDLVKELNAHAGRLTTLFGLLVAAVTFSVSNGPVREALVATAALGAIPINSRGVDHVLLAVALSALGSTLIVGFGDVLRATEPAVLASDSSQSDWAKLIERKRQACKSAAADARKTIIGLAAAFAVALALRKLSTLVRPRGWEITVPAACLWVC